MNLLQHQHRDYLAQALACRIAQALWQRLDQADDAYLMVSGGSTPVQLFQALSQHPLPWDRILVTLADERWVDDNDEQSNARLLKTHLLQHHASTAQLKPLYVPDLDVAAGVQQLLDSDWVHRTPDILVLGMGEDGHTASLFPDLADYKTWASSTAKQALLDVHTAASPLPRITFTGAVLQRARIQILHIHSESKLSIVKKATSAELPIAAFLDHAEIWWAP